MDFPDTRFSTGRNTVYELFVQTADRVTQLRVSPTPDDSDARTVTVRPIDSEARLRHWSWVEGNRQRVETLSAGRLAYIYMADTARWGYDAFNRDYFPQLGKQGVVLDERFNGGGFGGRLRGRPAGPSAAELLGDP